MSKANAISLLLLLVALLLTPAGALYLATR